jgi:catechol 2,3-dioxygenase-like lactoylglutathione lyase family enzyme
VAEPTQPAERMLVTHFIVSEDVERSRRFYTEVLGGTVVFGPVPTNIALPWRPRPGQQLPQHPGHRHPCRVGRMERPGRPVPDAAQAAPLRDPLLHPRSRRLHHRGRANHRPKGRLVACRLATDQPRRAIRLNPSRAHSA